MWIIKERLRQLYHGNPCISVAASTLSQLKCLGSVPEKRWTSRLLILCLLIYCGFRCQIALKLYSVAFATSNKGMHQI
jgi:hypothetical protein